MKTFEEIAHLLPTTTDLYYIDRNESLDPYLSDIDTCLTKGSSETLDESVNDMLLNSVEYSFTPLNEELASAICEEFGVDEEEAEAIIEEHRDRIEEHYYDVDKSTPVKDLTDNSSKLKIRVPLFSNYDCINSHWFEGAYSYKETYFGDMIDVLNLNPQKVKKALLEKGIECVGAFPSYKYREGKEYVSYEDFIEEVQNSSCGANLLTFTGLVDVRDLMKNDFKLNEVIIPKGNYCGIFSEMQGGGSLMEMELLRDFKVKIGSPRPRKTQYDTLGFRLDETNGYSIDAVYGMCDSYWRGDIIIN